MVLVGDVRGKVAVLVDDMADTCGTLELAARQLTEHGAQRVLALVTHGILSGPALERISASMLAKLVVTNTLPQARNRRACAKLEEIDISPVLAETIRRAHHGESISVLFNEMPYDSRPSYRSGDGRASHSLSHGGDGCRAWRNGDRDRDRDLNLNLNPNLEPDPDLQVARAELQRALPVAPDKTPTPTHPVARSLGGCEGALDGAADGAARCHGASAGLCAPTTPPRTPSTVSAAGACVASPRCIHPR